MCKVVFLETSGIVLFSVSVYKECVFLSDVKGLDGWGIYSFKYQWIGKKSAGKVLMQLSLYFGYSNILLHFLTHKCRFRKCVHG